MFNWQLLNRYLLHDNCKLLILAINSDFFNLLYAKLTFLTEQILYENVISGICVLLIHSRLLRANVQACFGKKMSSISKTIQFKFFEKLR